MILILGGTTEGRKAAEVMEEAGNTYYYSTKTGEQELTLHRGRRTDGAMDTEAMTAFCRKNAIRLIVDAAHPFARNLHRTVSDTARELGIPLVRYERIYPPRDAQLTWIDDYAEVPTDGIRTLLATTGVQSIARLKPLEERGLKIVYRILPRPSSVALATAQGATGDQLCYYEDGSTISVEADAILLKESGLTGGFTEKVEAARRRGMRIIVLKRPPYPAGATIVDGPHGLRRAVERLLPEFFPLKSGLTTGTCATAAALAAALRLLQNRMPHEVGVRLPDGETISVSVGYGADYAYCRKEAGDDPDTTDGLEIRATVSATVLHGLTREENNNREKPCKTVAETVTIEGGEGVGTFTLPGFDYPPGEAAINRVPREMIRRNLEPLGTPLHVTISVPEGEAVARRTFNPRLGIEGGISIIGVSGIVKPFSEEAFVDSIRKCMTVAKASGSSRVVLNSGAKSERYLKALYPTLPPQAFVQYGNFIGQALQMADEMRIAHVTLGVMLGKAVKLAEGQLDTHSKKGTMNRTFVSALLREAGCGDVDVSTITLARELWDKIPRERLELFARIVIKHSREHCCPLLSHAALTIVLVADDGRVFTAT